MTCLRGNFFIDFNCLCNMLLFHLECSCFMEVAAKGSLQYCATLAESSGNLFTNAINRFYISEFHSDHI